MKLSTDRIRLDGCTQPRVELDGQVINEYAERMRADSVFPAVSVFYDGQSYWLVDGFHRYHAWRQARPEKPIEVEVYQGNLDDARWYSYGANLAHGLRRTNADKEQAVRRALAHPRALMLSDRRIAAHCGVTGTMVRRYRQEVESQLEASPSPRSGLDGDSGSVKHSRLRLGRDGRVINTAKIGSSQRQTTVLSRLVTVDVTTTDRATDTSKVKVELTDSDPRQCARQLLESLPFDYLKKVFLNVYSLHNRLQRQGTSG